MKVSIVQSESVYQGRAFSVRRDQIRFPTGGVVQRDIVEHPGAVTLLPLDGEGCIWFVRQYRHAIGTEILELPAGTLEKGEDPADCARREIQEEIGMGTHSLQKLGEFYLAPGYSTEYMHAYLATQLYPSSLPQDEDEILRVEKIPASEVMVMIRRGQILDGKTLAILLLALPFLEEYC